MPSAEEGSEAGGAAGPWHGSSTLRVINDRGLWMITLAVGAWGVIDGFRLGFGSLADPGPGLWPVVLGVPTVLFAMSLGVRRLAETLRETVDVKGATWAWSLIALLLLMTALLPVTGMYLGLGFFCLLSTRIISSLAWRTSAVVAVVTPLACYLIFELGLSVRIPRGVLGIVPLP